MAESDLSNEVNATTVLPAPSNLSASVTNGDVTLSWVNNDDSTDGGIDIERRQANEPPVHRYDFESVADGIAEDSVGSADAAIIGGSATTGQFGSGAVALDGVDDYVELPYQVPIGEKESRSILFRIRSSSSDNIDWMYATFENTVFFEFGFHETEMEWFIRDDNSSLINFGTGTDIRDGNPHHVALVLDRSDGTARIYIDGSQQASADVSSLTSITSSTSPYFGARNRAGFSGLSGPDGFTSGDFDDLRVYDRAVSDSLIQKVASSSGSSFSTVESNLSPSAESYVDTSAPDSAVVEYRIERNTDHATATSGVISIRLLAVQSSTADRDATDADFTRRRLIASATADADVLLSAVTFFQSVVNENPQRAVFDIENPQRAVFDIENPQRAVFDIDNETRVETDTEKDKN
jgi:hypothetical protein